MGKTSQEIFMRLPLLAAFVVVLGSSLQAQSISPTVEAYLKVKGPRVLLRHVRVIDGTGAAPLEDRDVFLRDGKIAEIEPAGKISCNDCGQEFDLTGRTIFPGIVGMHDHLYWIARPDADSDRHDAQPPLLVPQMTFSAPRMYLAAGVTTMRTTGSVETYTDLNLKHEIDANHLPGPHLDVTGPYLEGTGSPFIQMHQLATAAEAKAMVDFWAAQGVTSFKAYMYITRAELKAAIDEAHAKGIKVTGHLCSVTYPEAAELGIDDLEHGFFVNTQLDPGKQPDVCPNTVGNPTLAAMDPDTPAAKALIQTLVAHHVAVTSTLPVFEGGPPALDQRVFDVMSAPSREQYLYTRTAEAMRAAKDPAGAVNQLANFKRGQQLERAFVAAGGLLLAGPDPTGDGHVLPGFGDQRELELLVQSGFTPLEAIKIGTYNGAQYLGQQAKIGSIAVGKDADLVVVKGDPSTRIEDIENVEIVFKDGLGYDSAKLLESVKGRYGQY
jgi:imidazolonepropionase-like amidohydrolase